MLYENRHAPEHRLDTYVNSWRNWYIVPSGSETFFCAICHMALWDNAELFWAAVQSRGVPLS